MSERYTRLSAVPTRWLDRERLAALLIALATGVIVFAIATNVFPYHSVNRDEGVYLRQAAMLLEGQLQVFPPEDLAGAFHPWFFVQDGGRLYPKYTPVSSAMYAVSMALFDEPRVTLAVVAAGNTALVYVLGSMTFDRRIGVASAAIFAAAPMTLVTSSVFLPYAPTTLLNLLFAVCYLHAVREGSRASAAVAGLAIGFAFFSRPYTAVLFAAPFIVHALWTVGSAIRERGLRPVPGPVERNALTAAGGLALVGVALAYNAYLTGSPLVFPYQVYAPLDGPGFGLRRINSYSLQYTPTLALHANAHVLWSFATRWFTAGILGTASALGGLALTIRRWRREGTGRVAEAVLAGLFVTIPLGNVAFWGNYNILGAMADPADGLISLFGPYYHFDLLVPLSIFAALAAVTGWRWIHGWAHERFSPRTAVVLLAVVLAMSVTVVGAAEAAVVSTPIERNTAYTDKYEQVYEPFEESDFDNALVFLPGGRLINPFQYLRNDPGFDGPVVYALDGSPTRDFAVLDAFPDRTYYRYTFHGEWSARADSYVVPELQSLSVRESGALAAETAVGVPSGTDVERARVRLTAGNDTIDYTIDDPDERISVEWRLGSNTARLEALDGRSVAIGATDEVVLSVTLVEPDGSTLTYRQETSVRTTGDGVEAIWPSERSVCTLGTQCGNEGTYLPDHPELYPEGVSFETRIAPA